MYSVFGTKRGEDNIDPKYLKEVKDYVEGSKKIDDINPIQSHALSLLK